MVNNRKDPKGRNLMKGESIRADGRYMYQYVDVSGKRKSVYSKNLAELRDTERQIQRDLEDGINASMADKMTLNDAFERYISTKTRIRDTTLINYKYMYDKYIRNELGNRSIAKIKFSDIKRIYNNLLDNKIKYGTLTILNNVLHPTFEMMVRDDIIRKNPTDDILKEIRNSHDTSKVKRMAMNDLEQSAFLQYAKESSIYNVYINLFTVFLGTGGRVGEILGLTWNDIDYEKNVIHINHTMTYKVRENGNAEFHISPTKTNAGTRDIPMLNDVRKALLDERKRQFKSGGCKTEIDAYKDFVFTNSRNHVHKPNTINRIMDGIITQYNKKELELANREHREAFEIRHFSVHSFRHTFATNYCQFETNLKTIQEIMGHSDISVTMNVYAEATEQKKTESFQNLEGKMKIC